MKRYSPRSLKSRLALWVFLPAVLLAAVDFLFTYRSTEDIATLVQQQLLKGSAKMIAEQLTINDGAYEIIVPPAAFELFADGYQDRVFYSVRDKNDLLIAGDEKLQKFPGPLQIDEANYFMATVRGEPARVIALAHAFPGAGAGEYAVTQVAQTLRSHDAFKMDLLRVTIREHLILLAIVTIVLTIAVRWTLRPLLQLGERLLRRQPGSLEIIEQENAATELEPMIFALNDYVARLDKALGSYEQFVADTAHQLRTSFAIITSQINFGMRAKGLDESQKEVLAAIQKTVAQGAKVINQLLTLAAVEQARQSPQTAAEVDAADIVKSVIEELAPLAQQKGIELGVDSMDEHARVVAAPHLLREIVSNLVGNSISHMKQPGTVIVSLQRRRESTLLSVVDTGPGIPEQFREKVFERFFRLDPETPNSSGLGLAIVKEICDALRSKVTLCTPDGGAGLRVDVEFPPAGQGSVSAQATASAPDGPG